MVPDTSTSPAPRPDLSRLRIDRDERPRRRWLPWAIIVTLVGAGAAAYPYAEAYLAARRAPEVDVARVSRVSTETGARADIVPILQASGYVVARRSADVGGKVGGRLAFLGVEEGDRVRRGQVIARIEHTELDAELAASRLRVDEAQAVIAQAIAERDENRRTLDRQRALRKDGITTEAAVTAAEAAAQVSEARVQSAQAALASARARVRVIEENIENTNVRAPFDGVVLAKRAEVGETVSPFGVAGQATREGGAIATIADLRELEVETEVSETNVAKVRNLMPAAVKLQAYPDASFRAHVRQIFPAADRAKAIVEVRVAIDDADERVKPEMTATVTFLEPRKDQTPGPSSEARGPSVETLVVPRRAVVERSGRPHAWVVADGKVTARRLTLGATRLEMVEVTSGLAPGEAVIVDPPESLTDGTLVKPRASR